MIKNIEQDTKLLLSKAEDCAQRALKTCSPCFLPFLSEAEQYFIEKNCFYPHDDEKLIFFGGYSDCDYKCAGFFPSFLFYDESYDALSDFPVVAILAKGSGFRKLSHRDFLGSLMSLGIKREVIGDIVVSDDGFSAYIFCLEKTGDYILSYFTSVANDKIVCSKCKNHDVIIPPKKFQVINTTVHSARVDALICACFNLSREQADKLIAAGLVSVNHTVCTDKSRQCNENTTVSVRHHGKFSLNKIGDKNKRDRLKIEIHRFV